MTLINIRGTSGSGKSTLVRRVVKELTHTNHVLVHQEHGRKRPLGMTYKLINPAREMLSIPGHYDTDCGGCDTIPDMDRIFDLVRQGHSWGHHVIFEGLLISADIQRTKALHEDGLPVHVVHIDLPLQECLDSVNFRRRGAWLERCRKVVAHNLELDNRGSKAKRKEEPPEPDPVNPKNTESKWKGVKSSTKRLEEAGLPIFRGDRDECFYHIKELLNVG